MQVRPRHARQLILCFEPGQSHSPPTAQRPEPYGENLEAEDTTHPHGLKLCFNTHASETSLHVRGETNCKHKAYLLAWPSVSTTALAPSGVDPESRRAFLRQILALHALSAFCLLSGACPIDIQQIWRSRPAFHKSRLQGRHPTNLASKAFFQQILPPSLASNRSCLQGLRPTNLASKACAPQVAPPMHASNESGVKGLRPTSLASKARVPQILRPRPASNKSCLQGLHPTNLAHNNWNASRVWARFSMAMIRVTMPVEPVPEPAPQLELNAVIARSKC